MKTRSILGGCSLLPGLPESVKKRKFKDESTAIEVGENKSVVSKSVRFWPSDEKMSIRESDCCERYTFPVNQSTAKLNGPSILFKTWTVRNGPDWS